MVLTEKKNTCENCELSFIGGRNEDCSLGGSISESPETAPEAGGGGQHTCDFGEAGRDTQPGTHFAGGC